jgi:predicted nucleic acid-binding protein
VRQALLDTSLVVSLARGEGIEVPDPPQEAAISAVTLCGLHHGVLIADARRRAGRLTTLALTRNRDLRSLDGVQVVVV